MDGGNDGGIKSFALGTTREDALRVMEAEQQGSQQPQDIMGFMTTKESGLGMGSGKVFEDILTADEGVTLQSTEDNDIDPEEQKRIQLQKKEQEQRMDRLEQMEKQEQELKDQRKASARDWLTNWQNTRQNEKQQRMEANRKAEAE